jgi:putative Mn2+ efflux pump MntP
MRNKVVGILDILLGITEILIPLSLFIFVIPKLVNLYSEIGNNYSQYLTRSYIGGSLLLIIGLLSIIIGYKSFSNKSDKYFNLAVFLLCISFIALGVGCAIMISSVILPIYSLTNSIAK